MLSNNEVEAINNSLLLNYGRLWDKPKYRLSWTTECMEERYIEGKEFLERSKDRIYLRDVKGIIKVPKYPRDKDRYVLEILVEVPEVLWEELVERISYEPIHIFKAAGSSNYREPTWFIVNALACLSHFPMEQAIINVEDELRKMDRRDYELSYEILDNELPDLAIALKQGSAVFMNSSKVFKG